MTLELVARNAFRNVLVGAVIVGACSTATTALADVETFVNYNVSGSTRIVLAGSPSPQAVVGPLADSDIEQSFVGAPVSIEQTVQNGVAGGDGGSGAQIFMFAGAEIGQFKLDVSGAVLQTYTRGAQLGEASIAASVSAGWEDTIRLDAGPNTRRAILHGQFLVHGSLGAGATASPENAVFQTNWAAAQVRFDMTMTGGLEDPLGPDPVVIPNVGSVQAAVRDTTSPLQPQYDHAVPQSIPYNIVVAPGVTFPLEVFATLRVNARAVNDFYFGLEGSLGANFSGKLGNTITWGGIDSVTDADTGQPIENWMITSESGFDYSRPYIVPEPSSIVLLITFLGAASRLRSRSRGWALWY